MTFKQAAIIAFLTAISAGAQHLRNNQDRDLNGHSNLGSFQSSFGGSLGAMNRGHFSLPDHGSSSLFHSTGRTGGMSFSHGNSPHFGSLGQFMNVEGYRKSLHFGKLHGLPTDPPADSLVDIPNTAINAGIFSTLVAALGAADLVGALSEPNGPYTVFAPTDDAFDALPDGLIECLLKPDYVDILSSVLLYHVVSGEAMSSDLEDGMSIETLNGARLTVDLSDGVKVNDVTVVTPDVSASNGVIHIVGGVLVPPGTDVGGFIAACQSSP